MTARDRAKKIADGWFGFNVMTKGTAFRDSLTDDIERALLDTIEEAKAQQRNLDISIIENVIGQKTPGENRDNIKECWLQYAVHLLRSDMVAAEIRKMKGEA